jgi:hypothetical protein
LRRDDFSAANFGRAPEQSLLSWLEVALHTPCGLIRDNIPDQFPARRRGVQTIREGLVVDGRGRNVHYVKWTGADFTPGIRHWNVATHFRKLYEAEHDVAADVAG